MTVQKREFSEFHQGEEEKVVWVRKPVSVLSQG